MAIEFADMLVTMRDRSQPFAVATVVEVVGSVSAKIGAKAIVDQNGRIVTGWVGGGCAESTTCQAALTAIATDTSTIIDLDLDDEVLGVGMPCGGHMRIFIEPVLPRPTLWIMGHGRIAECLCQLADMMGLEVVVNDSMAERERFPAAARLVTDDLDYTELAPKPGDYVVIATLHKGDHESATRALGSDAGYIALIASRKRSLLVLDYLREQGFGEADLSRVVAPAGLHLGARTPEEIALCLISEIVMKRRNATGLPMAHGAHSGEMPARAAS